MNGCDTQKIQEVLEYKHNVVLDIDDYHLMRSNIKGTAWAVNLILAPRTCAQGQYHVSAQFLP